MARFDSAVILTVDTHDAVSGGSSSYPMSVPLSNIPLPGLRSIPSLALGVFISNSPVP